MGQGAGCPGVPGGLLLPMLTPHHRSHSPEMWHRDEVTCERHTRALAPPWRQSIVYSAVAERARGQTACSGCRGSLLQPTLQAGAVPVPEEPSFHCVNFGPR